MPYYRLRYRRRNSSAGTALAISAGVVLALGLHGHHGHGHLPSVADQAGQPRGAAAAISYARHQLGCPYVWGGTGPSCSSGFDCSGLIYRAYLNAGITIPRTSEAMWAGLQHVTRPRPGDEVFFPGSDGSWSSPGHVGLYLGPHRMIQAYTTGTNVMIASFGLPTSLQGVGTGDVIGYARP